MYGTVALKNINFLHVEIVGAKQVKSVTLLFQIHWSNKYFHTRLKY